MEKKVGPVRTAKGLSEAVAWFQQWDYVANYEVHSVREIEVRNMLTVGKLIAQAAKRRKESRGGHLRQDYPNAAIDWCKHVTMKN